MPFYSPKNPKNQNFEKKKWKNCLEVLSFYTYMCIINEDHMIYGSWNIGCNGQKVFVILGHFLPFQPPDNSENQNFKIEKNTWRYYHFTHLHHKWQSHEVWFLRYGVRQTESLIIFVPFFALLPPNNPKNQNFEKLKKTPGDIIISHICIIIDNHIMYGSWDTERDRQNFLSFWIIFCLFTPLKIRKMNT